MRTEFHQRLDHLASDLARMCALAGVEIERATHALLQGDLEAAEDVITGLAGITELKNRVEHDAFLLLARQAPVAADLRAVVGALQTAADADRMGGLAAHIAKIARRRHPARVLPEEVDGYFAEMGQVAVVLARSAQEVVLSGDVVQAKQILQDDESMDSLHRHLFTVVMGADWRHGVSAAVDLVLLGRFYERFADHAVEIARRVIFQTTGSKLLDGGVGAP
ncbi:phosphate signaling complex protein PhoU [Mycolicibacterium mengxianglii]|uniref:phosphate signaling complex protein PhoU n=1 Tax=Mycolicibacterium mengxianglii TaxID=2736649 RepID=UPI0018D12A68|nr:phosphate signaling complex protein PhoU [Mycolicibacterium mengxianglii]